MPHLRPNLAACLALLAGCTFNLDRTLSPGQLRGHVVFVTPTGQVPATNAVVALQGSDLSVDTDSSGDFVFNGLPAGTYGLTIQATQDSIQEGLQLENLSLGTSGDLDGLDLGTLVLQRLGSISGTVQLSGMNANGATVVLTGLAQTPVTAGSYTFGSLPPGDYAIGAFDSVDLGETTAAVPQSVHVNAGVQTTLNLTLSNASLGSISGAVQLASTSVSAQSVSLFITSPVLSMTLATSPADTEGNYAVASLEPGIYTVSASLTGFGTVSVPFLLVDQSTTIVPTITLFPGTSGEMDAGQPDAGTMDAGTMDAGTMDAGTMDAGTMDAGTMDSGVEDAGPPDAGVEDGGPVTVTVSTIAGTAQTPGFVNGSTGTQFSLPEGLARDPAGNLYVADTGNCAIRKIDIAHNVSTAAGVSTGCGTGAPFTSPQAVTVSAGILYVADTGHNRVCLVAGDGIVSVYAGNGGSGHVDGTPGPTGTATFGAVTGLAAGVAGNIFVADNGNTDIRRIDTNGDVWAFAGGAFGLVTGQGQMAGFESVANLAVTATGDLYVADPDDGCIRHINAFGEVSDSAGLCLEHGHNYVPGPAGTATFSSPTGVAVDDVGYLYVTDSVADVIARVDPEGNVTTLAGQPKQGGFGDGPGGLARFDTPTAIVVNGAGTQAWVADEGNSVIRQLDILDGTADAGIDAGPEDAGSSTDGGIWFGTLAGIEDAGYSNGPEDKADFNNPAQLVVDNDGIYVADVNNDAIRKIADGGVTTLVGGPETGLFGYITAIATDGMGDLYVADQTHKCIWLVTGIDGAAPSAQSYWGTCNGTTGGAMATQPEILTSGLALDSSGNLYVSDQVHLVLWVIDGPLQSLDATGRVFAGTMDAGTITDGQPGTFNAPAAIAMDPLDGTVWVVDIDPNFEGSVRAVDASGSVRTVYYPQDGLGTQSVYPEGLLVDPVGNVYFSDSFSGNLFRLELITTTGTSLTQLASSNFGFANGSGGAGGAAEINTPFGMAAEPSGLIVFGDSGNNRVRTIQLSPGAQGLTPGP